MTKNRMLQLSSSVKTTRKSIDTDVINSKQINFLCILFSSVKL